MAEIAPSKNRDEPSDRGGKVYLVGAGPGDPGLLTLRGAECLARAEVVFYDYLVNPLLLRHAGEHVDKVCLGRHGAGRMMSQDEINRRLVKAARQGKTVVRLKSGDPMVFARAAEEIAAICAANIPLEIVPGITAALAVGSYAGVALTHRDVASAVALVTGQQRSGKPDLELDYAALARFPGTLVFYMGVTTARCWTSALLEHGKSPDTPAAIVRRCSFPDQRLVSCTLGRVAEEIEAQHLRPPVVVVVGEAVSTGPTISWFTERPLFGRRVLITRPAGQAEPLRRRLEALGAEVLEQPTIRITEPPSWAPVDAALARMSHYDWLVFSSRNGVRYLLERLLETADLRSLAGVRIAAIGSSTAKALAEYRLKADLVPETFDAEALARSLAPGARGKRFLLARASRGREVLAEQLTVAGGNVEQIVVYSSTDVPQAEAGETAELESGRVDFLTVTSSAIARSAAAMFGDALLKTRLVSISPVTSATLRELGFEPSAEAAASTMEGLTEAMLRCVAAE